MSEQAPNPELHRSPEANHETHVEQHATKHAEKRAETAAAATQSVEAIRHKIAEEAHSKREINTSKAEQPAGETHAFVTHNLKVMARRRLLKRVREQLPASDRVLSRVIHQPIIDSASELTGKTVGRPSGLLSGGIFAFIGSGTLLYIDKHYGYRYNFLLWALCFIGGFLIGLLIELVIKLVARPHS